MRASTGCCGVDDPYARLNSSKEQMMSILDNDLANVIQAERQREAAHERTRMLATTPRDHASAFSAWRVAAIMRAWTVLRLPVLGTR
jgi:hypothetical protein